MASTTASNLGGAWFGELASALQGTWQAVAATAGEDPRQLQQQKPARGGGSSNKAAQGKEEGDVARCGGAMSDTTLYLLLDRFTPN
ncbi:hypothetical protein BDA96_08G166300 [Sorghum bicolor]|uniref:Uncharacterized protein n=2 Tax=Sorghum bicolor TaxID=4558 RepID=A0A921U7D9_SORBI|nr:uncharacterized protein LOC8076621 [Sorghum bicolor]EES16269.1 hypothetical protein SORBI_3008G149900 [Sorghum bicolor]KAG0521502.1 hypothetical protein BDA96_08G166300 [Sorghum bicolor]|eukprot:XP_002442431.1 uncharacterized protein LOC8076621 [Sorghum bicolor]